MVLAYSFQEKKEEVAELVFLEITLILGLRQDVYSASNYFCTEPADTMLTVEAP
jgi:hypothetical protein